jgi:hypothetical protein
VSNAGFEILGILTASPVETVTEDILSKRARIFQAPQRGGVDVRGTAEIREEEKGQLTGCLAMIL